MVVEFVSLPDDILEHLFEYLFVSDIVKLECCCRRLKSASVLYWRTITHLPLVPFLQHKGPIDITNAFRFDKAASNLIKRCGPYLRSLDMSRLGPLEYGLRLCLEEAVLLYCNRLNKIDMNNRLLDRGWIIELARATGGTLTELSLCNAYVRGWGPLSDDTLKLVLPVWPRLEVLKLRDNNQLRLTCHQLLPTTLKTLDLQGCAVYTGYLSPIFARCPKLQNLSVTYAPDFKQLPVDQMNGLVELNVDSSSTVLTLEKHFGNAIGTLTNLRVLSINSHLLSDWLLSLIGQHLTQLQSISFPGGRFPGHIRSVSDALMKLSKLPNLTSFSARGNSQFGRFILLVLRSFKKLTYVNVSYAVKECEIEDMWGMVSSDSLISLEIRGFCSPLRPKTQVIAMIRDKLKEQCPELKEIIV